MIAMSQQVTPSSGWDRSIFEDATEDYAEQDPVSAPSTSTPQNSSDALAQLVKNDDFSTALKVKKSLDALGIAIKQDPCYMDAAVDALRRYYRRNSTKHIHCFNLWAALVPANQAVRDDPFFQSSVWTGNSPRSAACQRSALKAAHMGRASTIYPAVIPYMARCDPPHVLTAFMAAFAAADRALKGRRQNMHTIKRAYGLAIRTLCLEGHGRDAVDLLRDAKRQGYVVNAFTLRFLLSHLRDADQVDARALVKSELTAVLGRSQPSASSERTLPILPRSLLLRRATSALAKGHMPSRQVLRDFIHQCVQHKDHTTYLKLFSLFKAHRHRANAINYWASVEIKYYLRARQEEAAFRVFNELFHKLDLPRAVREILATIARGHRHPDALPTFHEEDSIEKIWPSPQVSLLLWHTLVMILKPGQIGKVYAELVSRFMSARDRREYIRNPTHKPSGLIRKERKGLTDISAKRPVDTPFPYAADHFRLFLRAYAETRHIRRILKSWRGMYRMGWRPTRSDVSTIARTFANGGNGRLLASLLQRLDKDARLEYRMVLLRGYRDGISFMMRNHRYSDAAYLAKYLCRRMRYRPGSDEEIDKVLRVLYRRLNEHAPNGRTPPAST